MSKIVNTNYGSIPHLKGSKMTDTRDKGLSDHQTNMVCVSPRKTINGKTVQFQEWFTVLEKTDGANVGTIRTDTGFEYVSRNGYSCKTADFHHHREFYDLMSQRENILSEILEPGDRAVFEYLGWKHSIAYDIPHDPCIILDIFKQGRRVPFAEMQKIVGDKFQLPKVLYAGPGPCPIPDMLELLGEYGHHGAIDKAEGFIVRVEPLRNNVQSVEFLCKYVRDDFHPGKYITRQGPLEKNGYILGKVVK